MKACNLQIKESVISVFQAFSPITMSFSSATVTNLFNAIGITCNSSESCLFIDSASMSLKAVLLYKRNMYPTLLLAPLVQLKEKYSSVKILLDALKYEEHSWKFKIVAFLMGLQCSFSKFPCYLCLSDSKDTTGHYYRQDWQQQTKFSVDRNNVKWEVLLDPEKVLLPPLHLKLCLINQFVTAPDKDSADFKYFQDFLSKLFVAKVKASVFIEPQIKKIKE